MSGIVRSGKLQIFSAFVLLGVMCCMTLSASQTFAFRHPEEIGTDNAAAHMIGQPSGAGAEASHGHGPHAPITLLVFGEKGSSADLAANAIQSVILDKEMISVPIRIEMISRENADWDLADFLLNRDNNHTIMLTGNDFQEFSSNSGKKRLNPISFLPIMRMATENICLELSANSKTHPDKFTVEDLFQNNRGHSVEFMTPKSSTMRKFSEQFLEHFADFAVEEIDPSSPNMAIDSAAKSIVLSMKTSMEFSLQPEQTMPLACMSDDRLPGFSDVPTFKEKGHDLSFGLNHTLVGLPNMTDNAVDYYSTLFESVYDTDEWQSFRRQNGLIGNKLSGDALVSDWKRVHSVSSSSK